MAPRVKILIISTLAYFLGFSQVKIFAQDFYYNDSDGVMEKVEDGKIQTKSPKFTLSWKGDRCRPPYFVALHDEDGVTVDSVKTDVPVYIVNTDKYGSGDVVVSAKSTLGTIHIIYRYNYSMVIALTFVFIVLAMIIATIAVWHVRKLKKAELEEEAEESQRKTHKYDGVTVLFSDIQGFTKIAEHLDPERLVDELDRYFIYFDELVDRYNVEKIKTIGDAYMCAGGVPNADSANPIEVTLVGLGMIAYVKERQASAGGFWNIRVGLNTGLVVSGQIGNKKKVFDIWGDSVNTASRMESSGVPGEVNVSGDTYARICDYFDCEYRGKMPVKYKGEIDMYFVKRLKPEFSEEGSTCRPNAVLMQKIQTMKVDDILTAYTEKLRDMPSDTFVTRFEALRLNCEMLCYSENLSQLNMMMAKMALMYTFNNNECPKSAKFEVSFITDKLKKIHFDGDDIDDLTKALSRMQQARRPETLVEEIVHDSFSLLYTKKDVVRFLRQQYECAAAKGGRFSKREWVKNQTALMNSLRLYTNSARELAEVPIEKQKDVFEQIIRQF